MRIETRRRDPRSEGDYDVHITPGYGDPTGEIWLDEDGDLRLQWLSAADCDRLIRAATFIRDRVTSYSAEALVLHGTRYVYQGTCQLCGKPEDNEAHLNGQ